VIADFATGDNVPVSGGFRVNSGRNTANLRNSADSNVVTFRGVHLIGAYRILTTGSDTRLIKIVEPPCGSITPTPTPARATIRGF